MKTRDDFLEYQGVPEVSNINCFLDSSGNFMIEADFGGADYANLAYIEEYGEYTVEDPFIGLVISTPNLDEAIDEFCNFYQLSVEDCQNIKNGVMELTGTTPITSSTYMDKDFDIFMLMGYTADTGPDTTGPDGDEFWCYGKFFAKDLASAKTELETIKTQCPWIEEYSQVYISEYNEYFDSDTREEQDDYGNPYDVDNNVFENLQALVDYLGWEEAPYYWGRDDSNDLPFSI